MQGLEERLVQIRSNSTIDQEMVKLKIISYCKKNKVVWIGFQCIETFGWKSLECTKRFFETSILPNITINSINNTSINDQENSTPVNFALINTSNLNLVSFEDTSNVPNISSTEQLISSSDEEDYDV